jgi:hypothetical protein
MAGFLDRLAARTLGTSAAAKPLVPVSFSPAQLVSEPAPDVTPRVSVSRLVEDPRVKRQVEIRTEPEAAREVIHARESAVTREVLSSSETVRVEKEQTRIVVERAPGTFIPVVIPRVEPSLPPAPALARHPQLSLHQAAPAGPIVRVSIGRIDVRAELTPAAAARVPVRASAPALSLEAYRRQRDGGLR